jgi:hypothetical protein
LAVAVKNNLVFFIVVNELSLNFTDSLPPSGGEFNILLVSSKYIKIKRRIKEKQLLISVKNHIGIAIMQGLSGSFGVVLCVPATVIIASWIFTRKQVK